MGPVRSPLHLLPTALPTGRVAGQPGGTPFPVAVTAVRVSLLPFGIQEVDASRAALEATTWTAGGAMGLPTLPTADVMWQVDAALVEIGQRRRAACSSLLRAPRLTWGPGPPMLRFHRCWLRVVRLSLNRAASTAGVRWLPTEIYVMIIVHVASDVLSLLPCVFGVGLT